MEPKIGCYICTGCEIGKSLDIEKLKAVATNEGKVGICKTHEALCSPDGINLIANDVTVEGLNKIVIAACSQRAFPELFNFGDAVFVDRANLREQVVWCHNPNDEDTQKLAGDYIRMGIARVRNGEPPEPFVTETDRDVLVIGGGVTGMTAAKAAADAGYKVVLVEKEQSLGGWAAKYAKVFPKRPPYQALEDPGWQTLARQVEANDNITVRTATAVTKTSGQPGQFKITLTSNGSSSEVTVGSIIQATGWKPYDPHRLSHLGYGLTPDVITNIQMEELFAGDSLKRPSTSGPIESIVFIQCAGSRDQEHLPYCSSVCCRVSLKQALYVREKYPEAKVYIIYKDIRTPAQYEAFYAHVQNDDAIFFTKGEITTVEMAENRKIAVSVKDTLFDEDIQLHVDMVVLATGMVPTTKVEVLPDPDPAVATEAKQETLTADGKKEAAGAERGARIINLAYRQGTDLPTLKYGYPDSHFICFPYETLRTGIYAAGAVRAPMDLASSENDAYGAALKAIQAIEAAANGAAVHPRSGDLSFPDFFLQRCTQCKRCTEECPFGALDEDEKGTPKPNPLRCRRCAICLGACPERIVSFKNYSVNQISQMIKSIDVPDEFEEKPRILAFVCENDAMPAVDMAGMKRLKYNSMLRIIPLRCLGSMNSVWVGDALARGFDGVILIGCKKGDDYQCHFIRGSELAHTRMENVREKLKQLVLEEQRVEIHEVSIMDYHKIPAIFDNFLEVINTVGPNPYKGM